jgi:hypothetical protein
MPVRLLALIAFLAAVSMLVAFQPRGGAATSQNGFLTLTGPEDAAYTPPADLRLVRTVTLGKVSIERYQQFAGNAQVLGGQISIVRNGGGEGVAVVGGYYPGLPPVSGARVDARAAADAAERLVGPATERRIDLMMDPATRRTFYRVESRRWDQRWFHWIDASSGAVVRAYNAIESGSGTGVKGDTKNLAGVTTFHNASGHGATGAHYDLQSQDGRQITFDALNRQGFLYYVTDTDDAWNLVTSDRQSPGQPALIDAQYYAKVADDFYQNALGFDWLACTGQPAMQMVAHYKRDFDNAFWSGSYLYFGDGDGVTSREYSGGIDVVAHESGHAVTDCTSALMYADESGALNESFSDIVGTSAEFFAAGAGLSQHERPGGGWRSGPLQRASDRRRGQRRGAHEQRYPEPCLLPARARWSERRMSVAPALHRRRCDLCLRDRACRRARHLLHRLRDASGHRDDVPSARGDRCCCRRECRVDG